MNFISRLVGLLAVLALIMTAAPAHAEGSAPVVTTSDIDVLADSCEWSPVLITNLYRGADSTDSYSIETFGPQGAVPSATYLWNANIPMDLKTRFCSDDLPEGHYTVSVDHDQRGAFDVYRPVLTVAQTVPPQSSARAHRGPRYAAAVLTLRGAALPGTVVQVTNRYRKVDHVSTVATDAGGQARARCPKNQTCKVSFSYLPLDITTPTVKVRRR